MKVILTAFGDKLRSEVMEFPDETPPIIHMTMSMDSLRYSFQDCGLVPDKPNFKKGKFERTAHSELLSDGKTFARRYTLTDIY